MLGRRPARSLTLDVTSSSGTVAGPWRDRPRPRRTRRSGAHRIVLSAVVARRTGPELYACATRNRLRSVHVFAPAQRGAARSAEWTGAQFTNAGGGVGRDPRSQRATMAQSAAHGPFRGRRTVNKARAALNERRRPDESVMPGYFATSGSTEQGAISRTRHSTSPLVAVVSEVHPAVCFDTIRSPAPDLARWSADRTCDRGVVGDTRSQTRGRSPRRVLPPVTQDREFHGLVVRTAAIGRIRTDRVPRIFPPADRRDANRRTTWGDRRRGRSRRSGCCLHCLPCSP